MTHNRLTNHQRHAGFTLLEAIVALVLIASAGMALFSWINGNISSLNRIHEVNARSEATVNILEYMGRVNPMLTPEGGALLGTYSIRWHSSPNSRITEGADYPRGMSLYQLALYDTAVSVKSAGDQSWFELRLQQVGYKKVRSGATMD
jgi:general secretion pathway protein I